MEERGSVLLNQASQVPAPELFVTQGSQLPLLSLSPLWPSTLEALTGASCNCPQVA